MKIVIFGAGGYSKEVADLVVACGYGIAGFIDHLKEGLHEPTGLVISADLQDHTADAASCAIGDVKARAACWDRYAEAIPFHALVHPSASVSSYAFIGAGTQVLQYAVVNSQSRVGVNCIVNVGCIVAHDCVVGSHTHLAPGVSIGGAARVGERSFIGTGAIILPGVHIGSDCVVGAGSVVLADVGDKKRVVGVPAREI
ncbi:MAG: NeuD/PglB/VioB family sugar acetyltransferase [Actinobacteria bacterium]|nr:NeuD/PglB/VioB family sugar acetyltransferase [Actinomycetota bacterium]